MDGIQHYAENLNKKVGSLPLTGKLPTFNYYKMKMYKSINRIIATTINTHTIQRMRFTRFGRSR